MDGIDNAFREKKGTEGNWEKPGTGNVRGGKERRVIKWIFLDRVPKPAPLKQRRQ